MFERPIDVALPGIVDLLVDDGALCLQSVVELLAPRGLNGEPGLHLLRQLETVLVQHQVELLVLGRHGPNELLFRRCQRIAVDDEVRCNATATVHGTASI